MGEVERGTRVAVGMLVSVIARRGAGIAVDGSWLVSLTSGALEILAIWVGMTPDGAEWQAARITTRQLIQTYIDFRTILKYIDVAAFQVGVTP